MTLRTFASVSALSGVMIFAGCTSRQIDHSGIVDPGTLGVSFEAEVAPIFASSCGGGACHFGQSTNGVNLSSYPSVMTSTGFQYGRLVVIPGNSADSPIVDKVGPTPTFGTRMPQGMSPLSGSQIATIRNWIDEGALDN